MQTRTFIIVIALLMSGFILFWKESDHQHWDTHWVSTKVNELWVDIQIDVPEFAQTIFGLPPKLILQISCYNSWCMWLTLKILCFTGIVFACVWYVAKPEPIYMPFTSELMAVSYNRGKTWSLEKWMLLEEKGPTKKK